MTSAAADVISVPVVMYITYQEICALFLHCSALLGSGTGLFYPYISFWITSLSSGQWDGCRDARPWRMWVNRSRVSRGISSPKTHRNNTAEPCQVHVLPNFRTAIIMGRIWYRICARTGWYVSCIYVPWWQGSWGRHEAPLGPTGPRWAPCWSHELCCMCAQIYQLHS